MFRASLTVRTADEARLAVEKLRASLEASDIPSASRAFLIEAGSRTLELWRAQLERVNTKSLKAEQIFDGSDYRIVLRVRPKAGVIGSLKKAFGVT
jgi:hypothetical protein